MTGYECVRSRLMPNAAVMRQHMRDNPGNRFTEYTYWRAKYKNQAFAETQFTGPSHPYLWGARAACHILERLPVLIEPEDLFASYALQGYSKAQGNPDYDYLCNKGPEWGGNHWHMALHYEHLFATGTVELRRQAVEYRSACGDDADKLAFYDAVIDTLDAITAYVGRWQEYISLEADACTDLTRKTQLTRIAAALAHVPAYPARSFFEAVQSLAMYHFIEETVEENYTSTGRLDYILDKYYRADIENGLTTPDEAAELIQLYLMRSTIMTGHGDSIISGGCRSDGTVFYNSLSYIIMDAIRHLNLHGPQMSLRYTAGTPHDLIARGFEAIKAGMAQPSFYCDETVIPAMCSAGFAIEDARNYVHCQCVELTAAGCSDVLSAHTYANLAKPLEKFLNGGREIIYDKGVVLWPIRDVTEFVKPVYDGWDDFYGSFIKYLGYHLESLAKYTDERLLHRPKIIFNICSPLVHNCLEKGKSVYYGGAKYNQAFPNFTALSTLSDSLTAVRQAVYEDGVCTLDGMVRAMRDDFAGQEELRQYLLNRCPKFGNGDPRADTLFADLYNLIADFYDDRRNIYGDLLGVCYFGFMSMSWQAVNTSATPDGRKFGEAPSSTMGGDTGRDRTGLTALINSATCVEHARARGGLACNVNVHPSYFDGGDGMDKMVSLLLTYFERGGMQMQFNCISADTLTDAKRNPDKYKSLQVRVSGFSSYFNNLDGAIQDQLIARYAHQS